MATDDSFLFHVCLRAYPGWHRATLTPCSYGFQARFFRSLTKYRPRSIFSSSQMALGDLPRAIRAESVVSPRPAARAETRVVRVSPHAPVRAQTINPPLLVYKGGFAF